ncbi:MaoC family dehydratase [Lapillicoccus jejuensis]|uniref:Acyl dehydratase n=1 Tax=Lapillicoccus jejuensis TaxID=402171 RepID=A0A542DY89_9MICO|nr:acyl dehydratase [Lapillicoccus jejuensis]
MSDDAPTSTSRPDPMSLPTVQQRGFFYEELQEGVRYVHIPGKTVEDAENGMFSALTMNPAALHHDAVAGEQGEYGKRLVNSLLTLSTLVGLSVGHITVGTTVANLGFARVDFPAPVFAGDTLFASTVVLSKRLSRSRPEVGIVVLEHTARNQDGVVVCVAERTAMMRRQPQDA